MQNPGLVPGFSFCPSILSNQTVYFLSYPLIAKLCSIKLPVQTHWMLHLFRTQSLMPPAGILPDQFCQSKPGFKPRFSPEQSMIVR